MKEQITYTKFTCDNCEKKSKEEKDFPYGKGWCYIYNFSIKIEKKDSLTIKDKHFCSDACMNSFIITLISPEERVKSGNKKSK